MNILKRKFSEISRSLLPVMVLVLLLAFIFVKPDSVIIWRFLIGGALLLIGLAIFLIGIDLGMNPMGDHMAVEIATGRHWYHIAIIAFLIGFLVTVAEPDLLLLGQQVEDASGGSIGARIMVYLVSVGVGLMIMLGTFRLLKNYAYPKFMAATYCGILLLSVFVSEEFVAISFDSSGATTGALTTPFVLALSAGLSRVKGGSDSEKDTFGMVGIMSTGPMYSLMLMSILTGQKHIQGEGEAFSIYKGGIFDPLIHYLPSEFINSIIALIPITAFFMFLNFIHFKIDKRELKRIIKGLIYTLLGLTIFLTGVYSGFLDMGQLTGRSLASQRHSWLLPLAGFLIGMIIVLVEPAVIVLAHQIEETTGGRLSGRIIKVTLSLAVALAVMLSMLRIMIPDLKLWHFLLPGFVLGIVFSFIADPIFAGIAFDAGGVASGPMTATFVLAFARGAAEVVPGANVLVDGFGVIAMVAMAPVFSLSLLGAIFHRKEAKTEEEHKHAKKPQLVHNKGQIRRYDCIVAVIDRGRSNEAIEIAREAGAGGATVLHGRMPGSSDAHFLNIALDKEKEAVFWITDASCTYGICSALYEKLNLGGTENGIFIMPSGGFGVNFPVAVEQLEEPDPNEVRP